MTTAVFMLRLSRESNNKLTSARQRPVLLEWEWGGQLFCIPRSATYSIPQLLWINSISAQWRILKVRQTSTND